MKITWRSALLIVCVLFAILMNACYGYYDECAYRQGNCRDSTAATFNLTAQAKSWWINDSIKNGNVVFKNNLGASYTIYKSFLNSRMTYLSFDKYQLDLQDDCKDLVDCDIHINFYGYQFTYFQSDYNFKISVNLNRAIPTNTSNMDSTNWKEYIEFTNKKSSIKLIPGQNNSLFNNQEFIPTVSINNKLYSNVIHVYDSTLMNKNTIEIVGYYFTPEQGIIRYYFNNNDVWSLQ